MPKRMCRTHACSHSILTPHAAVQEMSDLLDADLGWPALEVLTLDPPRRAILLAGAPHVQG